MADDKALAHRLRDTLLHHGGRMTVEKATRMASEWAPGRGEQVVAFGLVKRLWTRSAEPRRESATGWTSIDELAIVRRRLQ